MYTQQLQCSVVINVCTKKSRGSKKKMVDYGWSWGGWIQTSVTEEERLELNLEGKHVGISDGVMHMCRHEGMT